MIANLPAGAVQRRLAAVTRPLHERDRARPALEHVHPYPRTVILYLEARVVHADGQVTTWRPPVDAGLLSGYRDRALAQARRARRRAAGIRTPGRSSGNRSLATSPSQEADDGARPVSVTLVKRTAYILPPDGTRPGRTPFTTQDFYTLRLRETARRRVGTVLVHAATDLDPRALPDRDRCGLVRVDALASARFPHVLLLARRRAGPTGL